jgi:hypothetical protein
MKYYINRDDIDFRVPCSMDSSGDVLVSLYTVRRCIAMTPIADVAEIVPCKKCKYAAYNDFEGTYECSKLKLLVSDSFYCAYGDKRE